MSEELKQQEEMQPEESAPEETGLPASQEPVTLSVAVPTAVTMWNDAKQIQPVWPNGLQPGLLC